MWVRSPFEKMKYLFNFIFPYLRSGVVSKRGAMPREFGRKWGTECLNTSILLPNLLCWNKACHIFDLILILTNFICFISNNTTQIFYYSYCSVISSVISPYNLKNLSRKCTILHSPRVKPLNVSKRRLKLHKSDMYLIVNIWRLEVIWNLRPTRGRF